MSKFVVYIVILYIFKLFQHVYISLFIVGNGKTHYIKKCLFYKKSKTICINETFNKTEVVQQLKEHTLTTCNLALFLKISLHWPQVRNILITSFV